MELIDKSALIAEIEKIQNEFSDSPDRHGNFDDLENQGAYKALDRLESFLDTLEVKEMYLDFQTFAKEMETVFALPYSKTKNTEENPLNWEYAIAKHFFELGMQQSKNDNNNEETHSYLVKEDIDDFCKAMEE